MKRSLLDRVHDKLWTCLTGALDDPSPLDRNEKQALGGASVSGGHPWVDWCRALVSDEISSKGFRRRRAVREIVETLGPVDGHYFSKLAMREETEWLKSEVFRKIDHWGDPITWPGILLGTAGRHSPTSLRYLAHAIWMKREGLVKEGGCVVEIGVGFGGLAAMNGMISHACTRMVDLPDVANAATKMMNEIGMGGLVVDGDEGIDGEDHCVVSNYAFTELSSGLQEEYFEKYLRSSPRGLIVSNANIFSRLIGGRSDHELLDWFRGEGLDAHLLKDSEILGPTDYLCDAGVIRW